MIIKNKNFVLLIVLVFATLGTRCKKDTETKIAPPVLTDPLKISAYYSSADEVNKFKKQDIRFDETTANEKPTITIDTITKYQEMDGFGYTLTGGSAMLLNNMSTTKRALTLHELFGTEDENIGVSYLRISMGASDLDVAPFSYNDLATGETDENLIKFSISEDKRNLIPVLKEILTINPDIKILATPWSAPVWMKTKNSTIGGELNTKYYQTYANYFVKYIQAMESEGIKIDAVSIQNEPLHDGNNPSMFMPYQAQADFIKTALGPQFESAGIKTKIIIYDHNPDDTDYPINVMNDPEAKQYIDGSAFHLYAGDINDLNKVHIAHPDKNLYFTEQWVGAPGNFGADIIWHTKNLLIGATRNWCKTVLEWNLAADPDLKPHTNGGCDQCLGALTIDNDEVTRNPAYYIIAHASKFIRPGSVRVKSNTPDNLSNVAFITPSNKLVVIVLNDSDNTVEFNLKINDKHTSSQIGKKTVGTIVWDLSD